MPLGRGEDLITPVGYHTEYKGKHIAEPPKPKYDIDKRIEDEKESLSYLTKAYNTIKKAYGENDKRTREAASTVESARGYIRSLEAEKKRSEDK